MQSTWFVYFSLVVLGNAHRVNHLPKGRIRKAVTRPTQGYVWPTPKFVSTSSAYFKFDVQRFQFRVLDHNCKIVDNALKRYHTIITNLNDLHPIPPAIVEDYETMFSYNDLNRRFEDSDTRAKRSDKELDNESGFRILQVDLKLPCQIETSHDMDETYELSIGKVAVLTSNSTWGIIRGLETFSQLLYFTDDFREIRINETKIKDSPRYPYRGLMLDTSRHYISKENIFKTLDAMAYNKLNVFHWHIVDDHSFPYVSFRYPNISQLAAYHPTRAIYSQHDIEDIIKYATERAIRVIPEFSMPGRVKAWGRSFPQMLTQCYDKNGKKTHLGPFNPINLTLYNFLYEVFEEAKDVFIDSHIHLGGDDVDYDCWLSNPDINSYMFYNRLHRESLLNLFFLTLLSVVPSSVTTIVWQDALDRNVTVSSKMIVQMSNGRDRKDVKLEKYVNQGYNVVYSSCWMLNEFDRSWMDFYECDPRGMVQKHKEKILGGTACMFTESVDDTNLMSSVWPRASATAEVLWSQRFPKTSEIYKMADRRLEEQACRMRRRGIETQTPNGPGFCNV